MNASLDCLCVGILVADHLCHPIDHVPRAGELILSESLPLSIGGCAANVSVDLTRLGTRAALCGCVGADPFGDYIKAELARRGVRTDQIHQLPDAETSGTLIVNVQGEDRRFIHAIGANARFLHTHIPLEQTRECRVLYVGGYLLLPALDPHGLAEVFRAAREAGTQTMLDVVLPSTEDYWSALEPVLEHTDVFLPNDDEARALTGQEDPWDQAERFLRAGAKTIVITQGTAGCLLATENTRLRAGTFPMDFVGGTGAGDAFVAGFIAASCRDLDTRECLRWGAAAGASCVRHVGATESVFTAEEIQEFLRNQSLEIESL